MSILARNFNSKRTLHHASGYVMSQLRERPNQGVVTNPDTFLSHTSYFQEYWNLKWKMHTGKVMKTLIHVIVGIDGWSGCRHVDRWRRHHVRRIGGDRRHRWRGLRSAPQPVPSQGPVLAHTHRDADDEDEADDEHANDDGYEDADAEAQDPTHWIVHCNGRKYNVYVADGRFHSRAKNKLEDVVHISSRLGQCNTAKKLNVAPVLDLALSHTFWIWQWFLTNFKILHLFVCF